MENGKIALLHNHYDVDSLTKVVEEMRTLGAPTIRILDLNFDNLYQAVEGCHRLRACEILGITPIFDYVSDDDTVEDLGLDYDSLPETRVCELGDWENYQIIIEDGRLIKPE